MNCLILVIRIGAKAQADVLSDMSSQNQNYRLVTLNDRVVPGFAGIMRESVRAKESLLDRELKVVVASPSHVSEGKAIEFAKKVTKHIRISRGWSFVSASVQPMEMSNLPLATVGWHLTWCDSCAIKERELAPI
jgi:hypothetical protein